MKLADARCEGCLLPIAAETMQPDDGLAVVTELSLQDGVAELTFWHRACTRDEFGVLDVLARLEAAEHADEFLELFGGR